MDNTALKIERFTYDIIYFFLCMIELILLLRFLLKIFGANPLNPIVSFMYSISSVFMGVFTGIFKASSIGNMTVEPSVLVAMVFYAIFAYILVALLGIISQNN